MGWQALHTGGIWKISSRELTIQLIEAPKRLARWCLDSDVLPLTAHDDLSLVDQLLQLHEVLLCEKLQLATHFAVVDQCVQFLGGLF